MAFQGAFGVISDYRLAVKGGGVTTATLERLGTTSIPYGAARIRPTDATSGLSEDGTPNTTGMVTLWRRGEPDAPQADDSLVIGGSEYLITRVHKRFDADEASRSVCVYDCDVTRVP